MKKLECSIGVWRKVVYLCVKAQSSRKWKDEFIIDKIVKSGKQMFSKETLIAYLNLNTATGIAWILT